MFYPLKNIATVLFLTFFSISISFSQEKPNLKLNEIHININYTYPNFLSQFTPKFGFGVGGNHTFRKEKIMNLLLGVEYHFTQHDNGIATPPSIGHIYTTSKKIYSTLNHSFTFPLIFRFNIKTAFIKLGVLTDVNILMFEKGELSTSYYNSTDSTTYYSKSNYNDVYFTGFSIGTIAGIGKNFNFLSKKMMLSFNYSFFLNSSIHKRVSNFDISLGLKF